MLRIGGKEVDGERVIQEIYYASYLGIQIASFELANEEDGVKNAGVFKVLDNLLKRRGGGLLPLGGGKELTGGHKGYGLGEIVDIFSGALSSGAMGTEVYGKKGSPAEV